MKLLGMILLGLLVVFPIAASGGSEGGTTDISGTIEGGLRVLEVDSGPDALEYTIYRGDYVVFNFKDGGSYQFRVQDLEIDETMPKPETDKPYVKMKESGDYKFTLGNKSGIFHVLELENPNYHELKAAEAAELIENVNPLILDVRTPDEYKAGHIPGAGLLPVQVFAENIAKLEEYKEQDILVYCASGNRSTVASKMLIDSGFSRVYNLRYGIGDWMRNNLPVE